MQLMILKRKNSNPRNTLSPHLLVWRKCNYRYEAPKSIITVFIGKKLSLNLTQFSQIFHLYSFSEGMERVILKANIQKQFLLEISLSESICCWSICLVYITAQKGSLSLRISSVNVTKSAIFDGFGYIYWRNP